MKKITENEFMTKVKELQSGRMFTMKFVRKAPKCNKCNKSNPIWIGEEVCPICGEKLSIVRETRAQMGVHSPKNCTAPGTGKKIGESNFEANQKGRLKYFDMDVVNPDGTRGNYRSAIIQNILEAHINGEKFEIETTNKI